MAPNKFEEHIKEKLEKRALPPSFDAWGKLAKQLDGHKENNNKPLWWLGIAASVVALLLVVFQFYNTGATVYNDTEIVVTPKVVKQVKTDRIASENVKHIEEVSNEIKLKEDNTSIPTQKKSTQTKLNLIKNEALIAEDKSIKTTKEASVETVKIISGKPTLEEQKIEQVLAKAYTLKDGENQVAESEVEALLIEAQNEIKLKRLYNESTKKVDALALLQGVEDELDQSFGNKVFKALKENFITVKTAVAQRND